MGQMIETPSPLLEQEFRHIYENAAIGMAIVAVDGRWLEFNRAVADMTGYSAEELRQKTFQDITHPDDLNSDLDFARRLLAGEIRSYQMEKRYIHKDGHVVWILLSGSLARDEQGKPLYFIAQIQDITARKGAEDALRKQEALLRQVLEILPVGVWITDKGGTIVKGNPAGQRVWEGARYVPVAQYGEYKGWWADTGKPIAAEEWALARAVQKGETSIGEVVKIQCFDGTYKTILNSAMPLHDENGGVAGAIVVNEDITPLKQTEDELRHARAILTERVVELEAAIAQVRVLEGILPICSYCKNIRNDQNYWQQVEEYLSQHTDALFTHSICPSCYQKLSEQLSQIAPENPST